MKECNTCHFIKELEDFHKVRVSKDGRSGKCRICDNEDQRKRRHKKSPPKRNSNSVTLRDAAGEIISKSCTRCGEQKSPDQFHPDNQNKSKLKAWCIRCARQHVEKVSQEIHIIPDFKQCTKCEKIKPSNQFAKASVSLDGLSSYCRECNGIFYKNNPDVGRASNYRRKYSITIEQYDEILLYQDSRCALCLTHQQDLKRKLAVDHDHVTGKIRGLLCSFCNTGIGLLKETPELLRKAANYLESSKK